MSDKIWIPPEAIDENTRRMAWLLFLEWWKTEVPKADLADDPHAALFDEDEVARAYDDCLIAAKIVRAKEQEQQPTVRFEPDEPGS